MKAILVFIDGTICDTRQRHALGIGSSAFYSAEAIQADLPIARSAACLLLHPLPDRPGLVGPPGLESQSAF